MRSCHLVPRALRLGAAIGVGEGFTAGRESFPWAGLGHRHRRPADRRRLRGLRIQGRFVPGQSRPRNGGPRRPAPLAIAWGWTWVSDRWAGRSGPRLLLYTLGLLVASALAFPLDYALYAPDGMTNTLVLVDRALLGVEFVTPVVAFAAI